jgi:glucose/arabinose dehydrogenase
MRLLLLATVPVLLVSGCSGNGIAQTNGSATFNIAPMAQFSEPWAMTFLPDGRLLVTEKKGALRILNRDGTIGTVTGTPQVAYGGQGGMGDVVLHPKFASNGLVYLSWTEGAASGSARGGAVGRGKLVLEGNGGRIESFQTLWRQAPKDGTQGHFSQRIAFAPDGHLFITSGEHMRFDPAQDMKANLGKVIRLTDSGALPRDNPFASQGGVAAQVWSLGHRNLLGIAFDGKGQLWTHEMGPRGGDEFNRIEKGSNYGWPFVSNGSHYDGRDIPDHPTQPKYNAPEVYWNPSISPAGLMIYSGKLFPQFQGSAFIGGLSSQALIRVAINGTEASKADQWNMGQRIREVEQGPDGAIYLLEDQRGGSGGRLLKLTPKG